MASPSIIIPHGLAAEVLRALQGGEWVDEVLLVDRVRSRFDDALGDYPAESEHASDIMDVASELRHASAIEEENFEDVGGGYAWRLRRG